VSAFCVCLITSSILLGCSFNVIEPLQVGLRYDSMHYQFPVKEADGSIELVQSGRHFTGIGYRFVKYPTTWQTVQFLKNETKNGTKEGSEAHVSERAPIKARTADGLRVTIEGSFQYVLHLEAETLVQLFQNFGEPFEDERNRPYEDAIMRFAGQEIRTVASRFTSFEFFSNRSQITAEMNTKIQAIISPSLGVDCKSFQLLSVDLPGAFDEALQSTEVARQSIVQARYMRKTASIRATTAVIEAENDAKVIELEAIAKAKTYALQVDAELDALSFRVDKEKDAYRYVQSELGYTPEQVLSYVWLKSVAEQQSMKVIDVEKPGYLKYSNTEN